MLSKKKSEFNMVVSGVGKGWCDARCTRGPRTVFIVCKCRHLAYKDFFEVQAQALYRE